MAGGDTMDGIEDVQADGVELTPPIGASVWERAMFSFLTEHVARERSMLEDYMTAADSSGSKAFAYVVNMLVEDERRHHRLFTQIASSLKTDAELSGDDPVVPRIDFHHADAAELRSLTATLLNNEKADLRELKRLRKALRDLRETTLWDLLVDVMVHDTEKHIAILRFVKDHPRVKHG